MWRKEITDTLKQTALVLSFLLLIPIIFGINQLRLAENTTFFSYTIWGVTLIIPLLVIHLAYNMFASEDSDGALDYIRSLPVNKWKLLAAKVLPRLLLAWFVVLLCNKISVSSWWSHGIQVFWLGSGPEGLLTNTFMPLLVMISGFLLGISDRKNPFLLLVFIIPILFFALSASGSILSNRILMLYYFNFMEPNAITLTWVWYVGRLLAFTIGVIIPSLLPVLAVLPVYKSWDCSSGKVRSQRMLKRMTGPLGLLIVLYAVGQLHLL